MSIFSRPKNLLASCCVCLTAQVQMSPARHKDRFCTKLVIKFPLSDSQRDRHPYVSGKSIPVICSRQICEIDFSLALCTEPRLTTDQPLEHVCKNERPVLDKIQQGLMFFFDPPAEYLTQTCFLHLTFAMLCNMRTSHCSEMHQFSNFQDFLAPFATTSKTDVCVQIPGSLALNKKKKEQVAF